MKNNIGFLLASIIIMALFVILFLVVAAGLTHIDESEEKKKMDKYTTKELCFAEGGHEFSIGEYRGANYTSCAFKKEQGK